MCDCKSSSATFPWSIKKSYHIQPYQTVIYFEYVFHLFLIRNTWKTLFCCYVVHWLSPYCCCHFLILVTLCMCSDLDFCCTLLKNLHTVGCRLCFQERAIPCQELKIIQSRIARETLWFILFLTQSCGRWRSARPLFQTNMNLICHFSDRASTELPQCWLHILSHPVWTWFSQPPSSVWYILQMVLNSIFHQFGDVVYKVRKLEVPSYSYLDLE